MKNRILSHVKDPIFLNVKILVQRSSEKPPRIFYWINQIQCFIIRISVAVCWFQFVFAGRWFSANKTSFFKSKTRQKTFQVADPHCRLFVSVYEIQNNKWAFGDIDFTFSCSIWSAPLVTTPLVVGQTEQSKITFISQCVQVSFSIYRQPCSQYAKDVHR